MGVVSSGPLNGLHGTVPPIYDSHLPTRERMLTEAHASLRRAMAELGDALDWLRSDWQPAGTELTPGQATERERLRQAAVAARIVLRDALEGRTRD